MNSQLPIEEHIIRTVTESAATEIAPASIPIEMQMEDKEVVEVEIVK